jgi:phage major head subunit gpT-like protein
MSNAPVFQRNQYGDLFGSSALPVLEELFRAALEQHPTRREKLFKIASTDRDIWQYSEIHDMPLLQEVPEGTDYSFNRQKAGVNKTLTPVKYGLGFSISEEAVDDGRFDFIADAVKKLARSAKETQEINAMNIFNNGFDSETPSDGQYVFDSAHTLPSGATFRNELSAAADLSVASLEQMLQDFETEFVGDSGIIYNIMPRTLLVHPSNKRLAKELIGSDLKPETADNNMNSFKEEGLMVVSSPHLTDEDAWFMLAAPVDTGLTVVSRRPIETRAAGMDAGFVSDSILYKTRYREKVGVTHAYGIFGSPGA